MKEFIKQKSNVMLFFLFAGFVFLSLVMHNSEGQDDSFQERESIPFRQNWFYEFEDGVCGYTDLPATLPDAHSQTLTMTNTLPLVNDSDSLFFRVRHVSVRVYVNGELRVDTMSSLDSKEKWGKLLGIYYQEIPISSQDSGEKVVIESFCSTSHYLNSPGTVYLGDRGSLFLQLLHERWKTLLCCVCLALLGVFLVGLWLMETFILHQSSKEVLYLALFCLAVALWVYTESEFGQFLMHDTGKLTILAYEILILMPVPIALFFVYYSERESFKRASNIVATIPLVVFLVNNTLHSLHILHLADTLIITQGMLVVETISIAVIQIKGLCYKYKKKQEYSMKIWIIPLFGIAMLVPMASIEVVKYAFFSTQYPNDGILISMGVLIYMFALAFDSVVRMNYRAERFKQSSEVKSQFLANMRHEIRTPLNAILGFNEIVLQTSKDKEVIKYSINIQNAGENLKTIINSILDISKIESGKLEIYSVEYSTIQLLDHVVSVFESLARKKGITLITNIDENLPEILIGDENHILQVLMNIVSNAVKYTEHGSVTLTVKVLEMSESQSKCRLYISVRDTGIGIRPEDRERLFEKFERLDEKKNYNTEGTGLGMSIVVQLLRAMNSEIKLDSIYGKGSDFHFELIQKVMRTETIGSFIDRRNDMLLKEKGNTTFIAPNTRILVVDDLQMNLDTACALLEQLRMKIDTAQSGNEAIEMVQRNRYDIVLMDHMMPEMNGIEATQRIRGLAVKAHDAYYTKLPILALTANVIVGMRENFLRAGMQDYISKPIELPVLYATIRRWLPADKVIVRINDTLGKEVEDTQQSTLDASWEHGKPLPNCVTIDMAMQYCPSYELFVRNVKTYVERCMITCDELRRYCKDADIEKYTITVHGLKSSSRIIGLHELGELAFKQEMHCENRELDTVWKNTEVLIQVYEECVEELKEFLLGGRKENVVISMEEYEKLRVRVHEIANTYDMRSLLEIEDELEGICVPDEKQEEFAKMKELIGSVAFGDLIAFLRE